MPSERTRLQGIRLELGTRERLEQVVLKASFEEVFAPETLVYLSRKVNEAKKTRIPFVCLWRHDSMIVGRCKRTFRRGPVYGIVQDLVALWGDLPWALFLDRA